MIFSIVPFVCGRIHISVKWFRPTNQLCGPLQDCLSSMEAGEYSQVIWLCSLPSKSNGESTGNTTKYLASVILCIHDPTSSISVWEPAWCFWSQVVLTVSSSYGRWTLSCVCRSTWVTLTWWGMSKWPPVKHSCLHPMTGECRWGSDMHGWAHISKVTNTYPLDVHGVW